MRPTRPFAPPLPWLPLLLAALSLGCGARTPLLFDDSSALPSPGPLGAQGGSGGHGGSAAGAGGAGGAAGKAGAGQAGHAGAGGGGASGAGGAAGSSGSGGSGGAGSSGAAGISGAGGTVSGVLCPATLPKATPCVLEGQVCTYHTGKMGPCDDVGDDDLVAVRCTDGLFVPIAQCVSDGKCPPTPPAEGAACSVAGLDCFYPAETCDQGSIAQCGGASWHLVNACPERASSGCDLVADFAGESTLAAEGATAKIKYPSTGIAGTQLMLTFTAAQSGALEGGIYGGLVQTSAPSTASPLSPGQGAPLLGPAGLSGAAVAFRLDGFSLLWAVKDAGGSVGPGIYARQLPFGAAPGPIVTVASGKPLGGASLSMPSPSGGWVVVDQPSAQGDAYIDSVLVKLTGALSVDPSVPPQVVSSTAPPPAGLVPPLPLALGRITRHKDGFVVVGAAPANGDFVDDSGLLFWFLGPGETTLGKPIRVAVGPPRLLTVTTLTDGSVVAAYAPFGGDGTGVPFRLIRVFPDGSSMELLAPADDGEGLPDSQSPRLAPFEDGFVVSWLSTPLEPVLGSTAHVSLRRPDGALFGPGQDLSFTLPVTVNETFLMAWAKADRSLNLVWSDAGAEGPGGAIHRRRFVCQ